MSIPESEAIQPSIVEYINEMRETSERLAVSSDLGDVLQVLARRAREITGARYAAISVFNPADGRLDRFTYDGFSEELARRLGDPPRGRGLLGELVNHERPLRLTDLRQHPFFTGWPPGHPEMGPFLGIPIRVDDLTIGSLYMTRLESEPPFSEASELSAALLALQAAASVSTAIAREKDRRVSLLEEREGIAHDLHDGTIQSLYALGLECDALSSRGDIPSELATELSQFVDRINEIIGDIRSYITTLEAKIPISSPDLQRDLPFVIQQIVPAGIHTVVNVTAAALQETSVRQAEELLYVAREALSNATRHGDPTKIAVDLRQDDSSLTLTVQDNGRGFDVATARKGLGTVTMRTRAERIGGDLLIMSVPGMGTTIRVTVPRGEEEV